MPESVKVIHTDTKVRDILVIVTLGDIPSGFVPSDYLGKLDRFFLDYKDKNGKGFETWSFILHSLDVKDDGTLKTPHIHIVARFAGRLGKRTLTWVTIFADALGLNTLAVSVRSFNSLAGSVQYLIHKNDSDKYQYNPVDIHSSYPWEELKLLLDSEINDYSAKYFYDVCKHCTSRLEVIMTLGAPIYSRFRLLVNDIWYEVASSRR